MKSINGETESNSELAHRDQKYWLISQLSSLVQAIYETLRVLEDGSWTAKKSPEGLEDYPIGRILHHSHDFSEVLQHICLDVDLQDSVPKWRNHLDPVLREHSSTQPAHTGAAGHTNSLITSAMPDLDTTTVLLILSGYISLVKLHLVVFTHIEAHISTQIKQGPLSTARVSNDKAQDEALHFGELPFAEKASAQAFTAVRMLLDKFQMVEEGIGLPAELRVTRQGSDSTAGVMRRPFPATGVCANCGKAGIMPPLAYFQTDLIHAVLMRDGLLDGKSEQGFPGLLSKVDSLKALLRQNLGWE